jgi:protein TonB
VRDTNPAVIRRPTADEGARFYPAVASRERVTGKAVLDCQVGVNGQLRGCIVLSESPQDKGFADAALGLSTVYRLKPATLRGKAVDGVRIRLPMSFVGAK